MDEIWSIIGLSSLIAAVVTAILGIIRDVLVEKYHYKREKEAGYIQKQIQVISRLHFVLARFLQGAVSPLFFKSSSDSLKEVNEIMEENWNLIPSRIRNEWLPAMSLIVKAVNEKEPQNEQKQVEIIGEKIEEIRKLIEDTANKELIPKYNKIVGETVPTF